MTHASADAVDATGATGATGLNEGLVKERRNVTLQLAQENLPLEARRVGRDVAVFRGDRHAGWVHKSKVPGVGHPVEPRMLNPDQIAHAAQRVVAAASSPATVIMFGSYARGDANEGSDLDLVVVQPELADKATEYLR